MDKLDYQKEFLKRQHLLASQEEKDRRELEKDTKLTYAYQMIIMAVFILGLLAIIYYLGKMLFLT